MRPKTAKLDAALERATRRAISASLSAIERDPRVSGLAKTDVFQRPAPHSDMQVLPPA